MNENLPGRAPARLTPTRHAAGLADGIRLAQQQASSTAAPAAPAQPAPTTPVVGVADALRSRLVELFENSKTILASFYQYSQTAAALAEEYHEARLRETYPGVVFEELTLACSLDARETPATLDKKLAELSGVTIKKVVYDRVKATYHLYV